MRMPLLAFAAVAALAAGAAFTSVAFAGEADPSGQFAFQTHSVTTRAQVRADFEAHRAQAAALASEDSGSAYLAQSAPFRASGPVLAGSPRIDAH